MTDLIYIYVPQQTHLPSLDMDVSVFRSCTFPVTLHISKNIKKSGAEVQPTIFVSREKWNPGGQLISYKFMCARTRKVRDSPIVIMEDSGYFLYFCIPAAI